jgi:polyketide synthase PksL
MIDFVEYVIGELSDKRLAKRDALGLIRQFRRGTSEGALPTSLLHRNTSRFDRQSYEIVFEGDEPFLRDHVVKGHRVLPGVVYLEIVRQAVHAAFPESMPTDAADKTLTLRNIVWAQPIVVDASLTVTIALYPADSHERDGAVDYEISSLRQRDDGEHEECLHSRGQAVLVLNDVQPSETQALQHSLRELRARMTRGRLDGERVYVACERMGLQYGPAQRALRSVHRGENELLAHLVVPALWSEHEGANEGTYALHPSTMDAALQALLGLVDDIDDPALQPMLPFALDSLRMHAPCPDEMVAWVRLSDTSSPRGRVVRADIDLCDAEGRVCVEWRGFSARALAAATDTVTSEDAPAELVYAAPRWEPLTDAGVTDVDVIDARAKARFEAQYVLLCGALSSHSIEINATSCLPLQDDPNQDLAARYRDATVACLDWLRTCFEARPERPLLLQLAVANDEFGQMLIGLDGLLRSAMLEQPLLCAQIVMVSADADEAAVAAALQAARAYPHETVQHHPLAAPAMCRRWHPLDVGVKEPDATQPTLAYRDDGVYLVTGGLGGLGLLFARDILERCATATVVLTGRGAANEDIQRRLQPLSAFVDAGRVHYRPLDLSNAQAVQSCVAEIVATHGGLHGVLHCAGVLRDALILRKHAEDVRDVLEPKVTGTLHLDEACREFELDFFALFSGGAAVTGNVGQADYAAANGFLDRYAIHRNALVMRGERHGTTRAIDWPLWQDGGMRAPADVVARARAATGIEPLRSADGLQALHRILAMPHDHVQVVQGDGARLRDVLFGAAAQRAVAARFDAMFSSTTASTKTDADPDALRAPTRTLLREYLSALLKLPAHQIETDAPLEKYGINSIMIMNLTAELEEIFGSLPKTLFFEYQTLDELTEYFLRAHAPTLSSRFASTLDQVPLDRVASAADKRSALENGSAPETELARLTTAVASRKPRRRSRFSAAAEASTGSARAQVPVAIVGLSGRYPGARNVEAFWRNLRDGVDSIQEVPKERWDWRDYFSEDRTQPGRHYSRWGGFIEGVDEFDPLFFNIPPVDAERIDPQERLFLQHAWMAAEDAGYTRAGLRIPHAAHQANQAGQVGVYVGVMYGEYQLFGAEASLLGERGVTPASYASIANRVSYFMNLHGPSMAVDTMCSSSLTAIHLACQDLALGRTDVGIAGGVNVTIHPNKYLLLSSGQFIATDGRCQSFGIGGDGYIPAEGVGAVVLKRLSDAERDGNHIYGVIRASELNHGGKTNGYSVPNPQAQANVIGMALRASGVDPRRIGYLEAHGTGTKLGDPIEIVALSQAFRAQTQDTGFCLIGSAKSNIGHAESAAGIAGLTKVLLQMKHGAIAPSLHATELNPHIDFQSTPFEVVRELRPWERMVIDGQPVPRLAGVSSFGAGGSNAHLIIEEYAPDLRGVPARSKLEIAASRAVVLSARTEEQLVEKARDFLAFIDQTQSANDAQPEWADLAFTLQTGREAMEERLAFSVSSFDQLRDGLHAWLDGRRDVTHAYRGRAQSGGALALFDTDADLQATIDRWFETGRLDRVLELWVQGASIDWRRAYRDGPLPRLIALPVYPFARDRCWVERPRGVTAGVGARLHPLLHENISDLHGQAYRSTFSGQESVLDDHRVRFGDGAAQRLMPGVAYLDMMRAAAVHAVPEWRADGSVEVFDIAWLRPLAVSATTTTTLTVTPDADDALALEILSGDGDDATTHATGRVRALADLAPERIDLDALRARTTRGVLSADDIYARYAALGIEYGPTFRGIEGLQYGESEVLAQLRLPQDVARDGDEIALPPGLLDSALQSAIGLLAAAGHNIDRAPLPFALRSMRVLAPCPQQAWAWVRRADASSEDAGQTLLDIDLCNEIGEVCVALRGLASRSAPREDAVSAVLMAVPVWERASVPSESSDTPNAARRVVLLCDLPKIEAASLVGGDGVLPEIFRSDADTVGFNGEGIVPEDHRAARYRYHAAALLERLQSCVADATSCLLQLAIPKGHASDDTFETLAGLDAMLRTAAMEQPRLRAQLVQVPTNVSADVLARHLREAARLAHEPVLAFDSDGLRVRRWRECGDADIAKIPAAAHMPAETSVFREDGVYLITGGMGGLGQLFARDILSKTSRAQVVLTGRRALDEVRQAQFDALAAGTLAAGAHRLHYRALDLDDAGRLRDGVEQIVRTFGGLHGIMHSAGTTQDGLLATKTRASLDAVLAPKVDGTCRLDAATADLDLDFFALFASVSGALGNVGQADYAAANGFLDRFAEQRQGRVAAGLRRGRTVSIDWPLWAEGGMGIDPAAVDLLWRAAGVRPLSTVDGLAAFERALRLPAQPQVLLLSGDATRLRRLFEAPQLPQVAAPIAETRILATNSSAPGRIGSGDAATQQSQAETYVRDLFSRVLKVPAHRIDVRASLEQYGIDSVVAMSLTAELEKTFGALPKTLLFEHQTVERLARHLQATFPQRLAELAAPVAATPAKTMAAATTTAAASATASVARSRIQVPNRFLKHATQAERRVAIVGVAGRYPQADTLDRFWDNLRAGRDCITEVPADRWDHARYYDPARNQPGRTYGKWGGFLDRIDAFDARFFGITPREAQVVDPQERLFLETAWETVEDAGYSRERLAGRRIGVYVGVMWGQYELYGAQAVSGIPTSSHASVANRVSYVFDLHGPSLALDTMCSSSLSAIHLAAEDVRRGTVEAAIAGGVNLSLHPQKYLNLGQGNFLSSDGRCRSFGDGGDGYVPGEGVGAVMLKPLDDALRDGDHVYAVIEASALNHGGRTHGYTVPNPVAQATLIRDVLTTANLDPRSLDYIETHGTGTSLGDPIELAGLRDAFGAVEVEAGSCAIGSVKSNIGHLEAAAGIAALTKVLLQLRHSELVPSLHAQPPNPNIDFASTPFRVQTQLAPWLRREGRPRRAAISAFGAGGANAHLIIAEAMVNETPDAARARLADVSSPTLFVLSARDEDALVRYARRMVEFLGRDTDATLREIADTSRIGRTALPVRLAVLATTRAELGEKLARWADAPSRASGIDDCHTGRVVDAGAEGLISGDAGETFLAELMRRDDMRTLARLWVAGAQIDWAAAPTSSRRVSLPTYPFARDRHWVDTHAALPAAGAISTALVPAAPGSLPASTQTVLRAVEQSPARTDAVLYRPVWNAETLPAASTAVAGPVLVLGASPAWRDALSTRLGHKSIVLVSPGEAFQQCDADHFVVNPSNEDEIGRLVAMLKAEGRLPRSVVHLPVVTGTDTSEGSSLERTLAYGPHWVASLAKSLIAHRHAGEVRFLSLVCGDTDIERTFGAALGGFYASLHREQPQYRARVVEIVGTGSAADMAAADTVGIAAAELADSSSSVWQSMQLRLQIDAQGAQTSRLRRRWEVQAEAVQAEVAQTHTHTYPALKPRGVYLISGGTGALGRVLAESLARQHQARLVLFGRSPQSDAIARQLDALHALGGEAIYVQAEVADRAATEAAVDAARQRFGCINGVFHVAGIHRDAFLLKQRAEDRNAVFAPKVLGALHLDHATRNDALDVFVLFASVAGALGNPGQTDYGYANHFLDAFAEARDAQVRLGLRHGRTRSIDWPLWDVDGMRPDDAAVAAAARAGLLPLPAHHGLRVLEQVLVGRDVQTMVLYGDSERLSAALQTTNAAPTSALRDAAAPAPAVSDLRAQAIAYLRERVGEEIGLDPARVDEQERFDAFGIDSMMISRLNERLAIDFGELPKTLFYEYPSVAELAEYLLRETPHVLSMLNAPTTAMDMDIDSLTVQPAVQTARATAATEASVSAQVVDVTSAADIGRTTMDRAMAQDAAADDIEHDAPIAIVGMHGYYPQSSDLEGLWTHLRDGDDLIGHVPQDRWDAEGLYDPDPENASKGSIYCKWGAFLDKHDSFDAGFFRIGDEEARSIDPQERLFLQSVWAAFEDAGYTRDGLRRRYPKGRSANVGVYVGVTSNTYHQLGAEIWQQADGVSPSSLPWSIANRVSYAFDFQSVSLPVDTACSSSLAAIHLACEGLRRGDCEVAVAGGVNLYLHPAKYHGLCQRRMLAQHGKCRSYGAGDDGFVPGEGIGSLILKPLDQAKRDGDRIHGVILASGQRHSGRANTYSAPNPNAQAMLVEDVLQRARIDAESIGYVEGHGTGTQMGDSLEVRALSRALRGRKPQSCVLGSIKSNLGHTESAAGVLGVTKVLLQMRHRQLVPSLHVTPTNPDIAFERTPFRLVTQAEPWVSASGQPRRALVNAFGAGGVNACIVLEEFVHDTVQAPPVQSLSTLFVLSARTPERLRVYAEAWLKRLRDDVADDQLPAIAAMLQIGREAMSERLAIVVSSVSELVDRLQAWLSAEVAHDGVADTYCGSVGAGGVRSSGSKQDAGILNEQAQANDLHAIAKAWVAGADAPWGESGTDIGRRMPSRSWPTYPFADTRHRSPVPVAREVIAGALSNALPEARPDALLNETAETAENTVPSIAPNVLLPLHPLVSYNASNLHETRYASLLMRDAFYARDHRINGVGIMPGAAWLEIARVAGSLGGVGTVARLRDVVFVQPLTFVDPVRIATTTLQRIGDEVTFAIASQHSQYGTVVHCEGVVDVGLAHRDGETPTQVPVAALLQRSERSVDHDTCYTRFHQTGLEYGPSFRTIQTMHVGPGFVLARLSIDASPMNMRGEFGLHPALIDGALQSLSGFASDEPGTGPFLPFAIDEIAIYGVPPDDCFVHVFDSTQTAKGREGLRKFDLHIANDDGDVLVAIRGLSVRSASLSPTPTHAIHHSSLSTS